MISTTNSTAQLEWLIEKNLIFGLNKSFNGLGDNKNNIIKYKSILMFDLDYTLIKTKSGKKFPQNKNDWELLDQNILTKLLKKTDCIIGIISNQNGLKTTDQINDWIYKLNQISLIIRIDFCFCSINRDRYRKPMCGSIEYIKEKIPQINWQDLKSRDKIYYIGDACGRQHDFSDTDLKFALNCEIKFKTPEIFFGIKNSDYDDNDDNVNKCSIEYPILNYFTKKEEDNIFNDLENIIKNHNQILIVMIGFPASGKSYLRKEIIKRFDKFKYFNNDDLKNKIQSKSLINKINKINKIDKELEQDYNYLIDDNTNLNEIEREKLLKKFSSYYKIGIWFDYDIDVCDHLNWLRMYWFGEKLLPKVTYHTLKKKFNQTNINEGFDKFIKINKIFSDFNFDNKIKYYF